MYSIKELLRLKFSAKLTHRQIARALNISASTVSYYSRAALEAGLSWPIPEEMDDKQLQHQLEPHCRQLQQHPPRKQSITPCAIHQELKRKGVTLQLLWEEYHQHHQQRAYSYSEYCRQYRAWRKRQKASMRQHHVAGEKVFVDYAGPTVEIYDATQDKIIHVVVFIGVLGASNYTFAKAYRSRQLADWCQAHVDMLNYFGGMPEMIIPDNEKAGVKEACYYDPAINLHYAALAEHYNVTVLPTRPAKPQDKAKVEVGVQIVERWILAKLRHQTFLSLEELNQAIAALLIELNNKPFKKLPGTRQSQFEALDKPLLKPLPACQFQYTDICKATVRPDYHIDINHHYYSVPHKLIGERVEYRVGHHTIEVYYQGRRVASHKKNHNPGMATTCIEHMPAAHQHHHQWTPQRFIEWAMTIGQSTTQLVMLCIKQQRHPECCYRQHLGFRRLAQRFGKERLEMAAHYALSVQANSYRSVSAILKAGFDQHPPAMADNDDRVPIVSHTYIRGAQYYQLNNKE